MNRTNLIPLAMTAAALIAGVTSCGDDDQASGQPSDDPILTQGAEVYAQSCASCHGADLRGTNQGPSHLSIVYEPNHHPDDAFRSAIANGAPQHHWTFGDMPPVDGLTDDDVDAVIAYVRSEQQRLGFEQ